MPVDSRQELFGNLAAEIHIAGSIVLLSTRRTVALEPLEDVRCHRQEKVAWQWEVGVVRNLRRRRLLQLEHADFLNCPVNGEWLNDEAPGCLQWNREKPVRPLIYFHQWTAQSAAQLPDVRCAALFPATPYHSGYRGKPDTREANSAIRYPEKNGEISFCVCVSMFP